MATRRLDALPSPAVSHTPASLHEPLLTPDDVAALLGIRRSTIYDLARTGRIPHLKVGRALRFLRTDLEAWLDQQRDPR